MCWLAIPVRRINQKSTLNKSLSYQSEIDVNDQDFGSFTCEPVALSTREAEVITLIAEGYTNAQIADKLYISNHTVNTHRKNVMSKLGVKNTAGIVMYAVKTELVKPNKFLFSAENNG